MKNFLLLLVVACLAGLSFAQDANQNNPPNDNPSNVMPPDAMAPSDQNTTQPDAQGNSPANPPTTESQGTNQTNTQTTPPDTQTAPENAQPAQPPAQAPAPATGATTTTPSQPAQAPTAGSSTASAQTENGTKAADRVKASADVLSEIMAAPDKGIPEEILGSAECVAVVPSMLKGGFVIGGRYGRGIASCRTPKGWSAPAFFTVKGGSFGLQIGGQAVDLVMLVMNQEGMKNLLSSKFQIGADASAAAGPVGRHAEGETDWKMRAQILTYSRARGVFAGMTLNGASIKQDKDSTREFYGRMVPFRTSLTGEIPPPEAARPFLTILSKFAKQAAEK